MTTLSTHDTKRSEDVRARLAVLAEIPTEWAQLVRGLLARHPLLDRPLAHLVWQNLVGAWPLSRERAHAYAEKAAREAGTSTTWTDPDEEFEEQLHALVDPDNRRPVDYDLRRELLASLDRGEVPSVDDVGAAKLLVVSRTLRARRDHPEWFAGYAPLEAVGTAAGSVVAFDRGGVVAVATRLPVALDAAGGWQETALRLPTGAWRDLLTGARQVADAEGLRLAPMLDRLPVALLARE